jgi:hypothetical protein
VTRPDRFDIPGLSPEWQANVDEAFAKVLGELPKPVNPMQEQKSCVK